MAGNLRSLAQVLGNSQALRASAQLTASTWGSSGIPICVCMRQLLQSQRLFSSSSASAQQSQTQSQQQASTTASQSTAESDDTHRADTRGTSSSGASESTQQQQQQGSAGWGQQQAEDARQNVYSSFKSGFDTFKTRFGAAGADGDTAGGASGSGGQQQQESASSRFQKMWGVVKKEVADAVLPREEMQSSTRVYEGKVYEPTAYEGTTAMQVVKAPESRWERTKRSLQEKMAAVPAFRGLLNLNPRESAPVKKAGEIAEDLKERWETSDHPIVHKVEDVKARLFDPSEQARAYIEIRHRDATFDMNEFIRGVRGDAPVVVKAFLTHDLETLKKYCGVELLERFDGIFKHYAAQGLYDDPTILFTSEVELVEVKMIEEDPMAVLRFNCHQLKCTRDKFGNVVEGSPDSLQRVFYFWGLQQEKHGVVTEGGKVLPPRWVLKDMMWQSMLALV